MALPESVIEWEGLTLYGTRGLGRLTFRTLEGWEGFDGRVSLSERPLAHGSFDAPVLGSARRVIVTGRAGDALERDAILTRMQASLRLPSPETPMRDLRVTHAGRTLTAGARLLRFAPTVSAWGAGWFGWAAEWVCPDPLRYGTASTLETTFPQRNGGLRFPLFTPAGHLYFGERSTTGQVTVANEGTADMSQQFTVTGPVPPFQIVAVGSGRRLVFSRAVNDGDVLVIDSATGVVVLNGGDVDYSGYLTTAEWVTVPAGGSETFAFLPLGDDAGTGSLAVTWRSA